MMDTVLIFAVVFVTLVAVWIDFRAYHKTLRAIHIALSGLTLLGLISQPEWLSRPAKTHILLTQGFTQSEESRADIGKVFSLLEDHKFSTDTSWISHPELLSTKLGDGSRLEIRGFGTSESLPENYKWIDGLTAPENGIVVEKSLHSVEVGKSFELRFSLVGFSEEDSIIVFKDGFPFPEFSRASDSSLIITDKLLAEGPASFDIEWISEDTLITETWNIRGIAPEKLSIAVLGYSPSFEINQLVAHLGALGHSVHQRNRIGKDKFRYDAINSKLEKSKSFFKHIAEYDLLILDEREYQNLRKSEQKSLETAISKGLDVILNPPNQDRHAQWSDVFSRLSDTNISLTPIDRLVERSWRIPSENEASTSRLPLQNYVFESIPKSAIHLFQDERGDAVALKSPRENGSISGHLFHSSYAWILEGNDIRYNRFWMEYLGKIIALEQSNIEVSPPLPRQNRRTEIYHSNQSESGITVNHIISGTNIALNQSIATNHPQVNHSIFWPENTGWHKITTETNSQWMYVYRNEEWKFDREYRAYQTTRQTLSRMQLTGKSSDEEKRAFPNYVWILGFLVLQGLLWVERKV